MNNKKTDQIVNFIFYIDIISAVGLPLIGWYYDNTWLISGGFVSLLSAIAKPMRHINDWLMAMAGKMNENN